MNSENMPIYKGLEVSLSKGGGVQTKFFTLFYYRYFGATFLTPHSQNFGAAILS